MRAFQCILKSLYWSIKSAYFRTHFFLPLLDFSPNHFLYSIFQKRARKCRKYWLQKNVIRHELRGHNCPLGSNTAPSVSSSLENHAVVALASWPLRRTLITALCSSSTTRGRGILDNNFSSLCCRKSRWTQYPILMIGLLLLAKLREERVRPHKTGYYRPVALEMDAPRLDHSHINLG